jgi:hypothetical protein
MSFCFFCTDTRIPSEIVLNDSITDISEEIEGSKIEYIYKDDEEIETDYEKHILTLNLNDFYENTEKLTLVFITTVGYSIILAVIYNLFRT